MPAPSADPASPSPTSSSSGNVLPAWISDTFAAKYASQLMKQVGHTPVGQVAQRILDDPFIFLHQVRIGGLRESIASANASITASVAPTRLGGTIVGAAVGALSGAGQAMLTFPGTSTLIVGTLHGLVVGAVSGNVAVVESRHSRQAEIKAADRLW
ncbi:MAG TPA: hypothetical protein V6D23_25510 [Candidatus Obscuribacterales bacterium]